MGSEIFEDFEPEWREKANIFAMKTVVIFAVTSEIEFEKMLA